MVESGGHQCPDSEVRIVARPHVCELRNRKDTSKPIDLVWLWFRSPHDELAARMMRTSEPPHLQPFAKGEIKMCRNIKTLFNFEPPATDVEINASALQFVRKLSGFNKPSQANEAAFERAVEEVTAAAHRLLTSLHTHAPARDRATDAEKAKERSRLRFG